MEIEAKFQAPNAEVLRALREATHVAGFPLGPSWTEEFADTYLDTENWQILAGGYFCRRRLSEGQVLITIKQVETAGDACIAGRNSRWSWADTPRHPAGRRAPPGRRCWN